MHRDALADLAAWKRRGRRKPLVIRGARQVGKTTLVRLFAEQHFERLVEINLERDPSLGALFASKDPRKILPLLEVHLETGIEPGRTLLLLDEIQAAPEVLAALRYFYEELPELHVVAAGSLLELVLEEPPVPVPVGRIEYLHLGPMRFGEFLRAAGRQRLADFLAAWRLGEEIAPPLHQELLGWLARFLAVGGMPDAVRAFAEEGAYREAEAVKQSVLATFRDDFGKYGRRTDVGRLRKVFERLPPLVGRQFKYVHIDREERSRDLAAALRLLVQARVAHRVHHTAANGVPLGAEADERKFKLLFLDVGLTATATGLSILDLEAAEDPMLVHQGVLCEQFVGQHLLYSGPSWEEPRLFYWRRQKPGSAAEVDYVIAIGPQVLPVEVKAGTTGRLRSLHLFLREKGRSLGLRLSSAPPSLLDTTATLPDGGEVSFRLLSLPLYLVGEVRRLCGELVLPAFRGGES